MLTGETGEKSSHVSGGIEFYFATGQGLAGPLILFHHIHKTSGTSIRRLIRHNLAGVEAVVERPPAKQQVREAAALSRWYRQYYAGLSPDRRQRLRCVMSHSANHLLPVLDRPVAPICMLREPVDHAMSQYYFGARRKGDRGGKPGKTARGGVYLSGGLRELYARLAGGDDDERQRLARFFNGQSRSLLAPYEDLEGLSFSAGPPPDADLWRERAFRAADRYTIGLQDRFQEFAHQLAERFGWEAIVFEAKVNPERPPREDLQEDVAEIVRAYNWLDVELYSRAAAAATAAGSR